MNLMRQIHFYLGMFFAPAIIFFALTGAVMTFELHESRPGKLYRAPVWLALPAQIHKKQSLDLRPERRLQRVAEGSASRGVRDLPDGKPPDSRNASTDADEERTPLARSTTQDREPRKQPSMPLKWFFLITSVALILFTISGIYLTCKITRKQRLAWSLLALGTVLPLLLLYL